MIAGLAVALLLGGVANGVLPSMWQLASSHPLFWLDQLSYTRSVKLVGCEMQHINAVALDCHQPRAGPTGPVRQSKSFYASVRTRSDALSSASASCSCISPTCFSEPQVSGCLTNTMPTPHVFAGGACRRCTSAG